MPILAKGALQFTNAWIIIIDFHRVTTMTKSDWPWFHKTGIVQAGEHWQLFHA
jgi:hypothetical protein